MRGRVAACLILVTACSAIPRTAPGVEPGAVSLLAPDPIDGPANLPLAARARSEGCYLHLLVRSTGLKLTTGAEHMASLFRGDGRRKPAVGHCWVRLETPEETIGVGHTGEEGKLAPSYLAGVEKGIREHRPDPVSYLWKPLYDGRRWNEDPGFWPSYHCRVPITRAQAEAIHHYIDTFDFREFALRGRACSHFAVGAANLAGLEVPNRIRVEIPREVSWRGERITLWTNPEYSVIQYGSPELFERGLRELVAEGAAEEVR